MVQIEDGKGRGHKAGVTDENFEMVAAVTESEEHHANQQHGTAYHLLFACSNIFPDACFLYMKNTDDVDLTVEGVKLFVQCDAKVVVVTNPTVTTVTGASVTPANVNAGAGNVADGSFYQAMSGCVSGVTGGTEVERYFKCSGCDDKHWNHEMDIIVPKNMEYALFLECCSGCNIAGTIPFYIHGAIE